MSCWCFVCVLKARGVDSTLVFPLGSCSFFAELQRRRNTIKWHPTLWRSCLLRASCVRLTSTTPCLAYKMCQRPQCESFRTPVPLLGPVAALFALNCWLTQSLGWVSALWTNASVYMAFIFPRVIPLSLCCLQVRGGPDLWAAPALQWKDGEYTAAGICGGAGCQSAQAEETKHGCFNFIARFTSSFPFPML